MSYVYEDSAFIIDETIEHEDCPECKGGTLNAEQMTTVYDRVLTSSGGYENRPVFHDPLPVPDHIAGLPHGYPCSNEDCYLGKILTPYERTMQKIVYGLTAQMHAAQKTARDTEASVQKFEESMLLKRVVAAGMGKIPRFQVINLPDRAPIIRPQN